MQDIILISRTTVALPLRTSHRSRSLMEMETTAMMDIMDSRVAWNYRRRRVPTIRVRDRMSMALLPDHRLRSTEVVAKVV